MSLMFRYHFRILWVYLRWRLAGKPRGNVSRLSLRAKAADCDWLGHVNNARYLEIFDAARTDLILRNGMAAMARAEQFIAVVGTINCRYRREVKRGARFVVESRFARFEGKAVVFSQKIFLGDTLATEAEASVLLVRGGKVLDPAILSNLLQPSP